MEKEKKQRKKKEIKINDKFLQLNFDGIEWGEFDKLNDKEKMLAFLYVFRGFGEYQNPINHDQYQCALQAGYTKRTAHRISDKFKNPEFKNCIKMLELQFNTVPGIDLLHRANEIERAALYRDARNYLKSEEFENKETGEVGCHQYVKNVNEWTDEMALAVEKFEINQAGILNLVFPDRLKIIKDIRDRYERINKKEENSDDFDEKTTVEIVKETLNNSKITVRVANENVRRNAENYIENSEELPDYD